MFTAKLKTKTEFMTHRADVNIILKRIFVTPLCVGGRQSSAGRKQQWRAFVQMTTNCRAHETAGNFSTNRKHSSINDDYFKSITCRHAVG